MTNSQENQEKTFFIPYIVNIPGRVLESGISMSCIKLFSLLVGLSSQYGYSWVTNQDLAEHFEVEERTVERWFETLRKIGFIRCEYKQTSYRTDSNDLRWKKERKTFVTPAFTEIQENSKNVCDTDTECRDPTIPTRNVGLKNNITLKETNLPDLPQPPNPPSSERSASSAPPAVSKSSIEERKELLKGLELTDVQMMTLSRHDTEDLKKALAYYHLQETKPTSLFGWFCSCLKHKYWEGSLPGLGSQKDRLSESSQAEIKQSLLDSFKCVYEAFPESVGVSVSKVGFDLCFSGNFYSAKWEELKGDKCDVLARWMTKNLQGKAQVVYNQLSGNNKFEVLWK